MINFADVMNFDLALLNIGFNKQNCGCEYKNVCSSFARLFWATEGNGTVVFDGEAHLLTAGHLYLIPPLVTHHVHNVIPNSHYYVYFTDCSMRIYDHFQQYCYPFEIPVTETDKKIIHYLLTLAPDISLADYNPKCYDQPQVTMQGIRNFKNLPVATRLEINGLLQILLSHFTAKAVRRTTASDQRIRNAMWRINHDLSAVPSLDQLSADACMNKNSFIRLFRQQTGFTPTDYIIRSRITRAQILFISTPQSVKEIACQVGFDNISYFGRTFKRIVGISPLEFIRQNK